MLNTCIQRNNERLLSLIKIKRVELINLVAKNGLTDHLVVKCSQELDQLIYEIQLQYQKGQTNNIMEIREMDGIH
ncbi:aspartyl-phosphate phosphatase Spo0E family protein [Bacillus sp. T3]|uniref:aspartyl-phosphate phosphatase Spo0E family protein n=1 Tax=Bacillus sp. T3 TaxID=467262 RepID=UPI0029828FAE|nr:aspartyl-phosphate phosphatase Spo0E family protein [Bacillus sp. T3]